MARGNEANWHKGRMERRWYYSPGRWHRSAVRERGFKEVMKRQRIKAVRISYKSGATDSESSKTKEDDRGVQLMSE